MRQLTYRSLLLSTIISMGHIAYGAGIESNENDKESSGSGSSWQSITQETMGGATTARGLRRPHEHYCPITKDIMKDPVVASDGFSYERDAITRWIASNRISPMTRQPLGADLHPNQILRTLISDWNTRANTDFEARADSGINSSSNEDMPITEIWLSDSLYDKGPCGRENSGAYFRFKVRMKDKTKLGGQVSFSPNAKSGIGYRNVLPSLTTLSYFADNAAKMSNDIINSDSAGSKFCILENNKDSEKAEKIRTEGSKLISWTLPNTFLSLEDVIGAINRLKKDEKLTGEEKNKDGTTTKIESTVSLYPKYKYVGYDWNYNYYNCISYSLKLIEALGVNLKGCKELYPYLQREDFGLWNGVRYYAFSTTRFTGVFQIDAIQLAWVMEELAKNKKKIDWKFNHQTVKAIFDISGIDRLNLKSYFEEK